MSSKSASSSKSPEEIAEITEQMKDLIQGKLEIVKDVEDMPSIKGDKSTYKLRIFDEIMPDGKTKGKRVQLFKGDKMIGDKVVPKSEWKKIKAQKVKEIKKEVEKIKKNPEKMDELLDKVEDIKKKDVPQVIMQDPEEFYFYKQQYQEYKNTVEQVQKQTALPWKLAGISTLTGIAVLAIGGITGDPIADIGQTPTDITDDILTYPTASGLEIIAATVSVVTIIAAGWTALYNAVTLPFTKGPASLKKGGRRNKKTRKSKR